RFGIDLIAERIEAEGAVVDLLDYDVRFGQGFLFSPPRPVRAEALQGADAGNPADQAKRDASAPRGAGLAQLARTGSGRP
ncbi:MAG TPA: EAL domain-containing protein, partial [Xanthobacteraceae bacterium]|nr:EAL domain-containing protein [Xanthobacteraceae bacterium]